MIISTWFDDLPVLGKLPAAQAAAKLREMGESGLAVALEASQDAEHLTYARHKGWWPFQDKPWQHTAHAFGYLAPTKPGNVSLPIKHAGNIAADMTLKNARIKITLDRLRIADYPGGGTHHILFDFYAQNQVPGNVEHLHFNTIYRVREGEQAAILGYPIFVGLNVDEAGVAFKCYTVNVKNEADETFLSFLESDVFKAGLKLTSTMQPAIAPLSEMAFALTRSVASRRRNVPIQEFYLGLDFSSVPTRARLCEGAYLAVQIPETFQSMWDWSDWVYNPSSGQVVSQVDRQQLIPYNYLVFSISRYHEDQ
jgi:hypothetical protein